jgi:hypothetical protein
MVYEKQADSAVYIRSLHVGRYESRKSNAAPPHTVQDGAPRIVGGHLHARGKMRHRCPGLCHKRRHADSKKSRLRPDPEALGIDRHSRAEGTMQTCRLLPCCWEYAGLRRKTSRPLKLPVSKLCGVYRFVIDMNCYPMSPTFGGRFRSLSVPRFVCLSRRPRQWCPHQSHGYITPFAIPSDAGVLRPRKCISRWR